MQARIRSVHRKLGVIRRPKRLDFTGVDLIEPSSKSAPAIDQPNLRFQNLYYPMEEKNSSSPPQDYSPKEEKHSPSPSAHDCPVEQQMIYIPRGRSFTR